MMKSPLLVSLALALSFCVTSCSSDQKSAPVVTLDVTYPEEGQILTTSLVRVRGNASNTDTVTVNGRVADVVGGEWEALVEFEQGDVAATAEAGGKSSTVNFVVDSFEPQLVVTSPERAFYADENTIVVRGTVTDDGTGIDYVDLGGQDIEVKADGSFETTFTLQEGYNELAIRARDNAGNISETIRGGMWGPMIDPTETIDPMFQVFVRQEAVDTVEGVVEAYITPEYVTEFIKENFAYESVTVDSISFDPLDVELIPRQGRMDLELDVTNAEITGSFTIGEEVYPTTITLRKFKVLIEMNIAAAEDGTLDFSFGQAELELAEEDLLFTIEALTQDDVEFLRNLVVDVARSAFGGLLSETIFEALFDPEVLKRRIELLDRTLVFELRFEDVRIFPDGILLQLSLKMPEEKFPEVPDVPGALAVEPDNPNGPNTENDIIFTTTRNGVDRLLHGVWRSGLLHQELRGNDFGGQELPVELTSGALALVLDPEITNLAPADTPAGIRLRPMLPPVIELGAEGIVGVKMGEVHVDVLLFPPSGEEVKIATVANFLDLTVAIGLEGAVVKLDFGTAIRSDVADEPNLDLDDEAIEGLIESIVALVPEVLEQSLSVRGEADITWVLLQDPTIEVHGVKTDHLSVSLNMVPNPDGFAPPTTDTE